MNQITARVPDTLIEALDAAAMHLTRSRADIVREALERYLEDLDDFTVSLERLYDPTDAELGWDQVKQELRGPD